MATDTELENHLEHESIDLELKDLNIDAMLRANKSFMRLVATIFHYGNQSLSATQLVNCVRSLELLPLRTASRKANLLDPFVIEKYGAQRQTKYRLSDACVGNAVPPKPKVVPEDNTIEIVPVVPVAQITSPGKRQRKAPELYTPTTKIRQSAQRNRKRPRTKKPKHKAVEDAADDMAPADSSQSDIDVEEELTLEERMQIPVYSDDSDVEDSKGDGQDDDAASFDSMGLGSDYEELLGKRQETKALPPPPPPPPQVVEEDTIANYSLIYAPPNTAEMDYIDTINFSEYSIASNFAIVQQKGYSYPRFRSQEKIKIPKVHCEDKFRVSDISKNKRVVGRLFVLADGHGGPGCSEYFVRNTPQAVEVVCSKYLPSKLGEASVRAKLEKDIKAMIQQLDDSYLDLKRQQIAAAAEKSSETVDNDGCTLILNLFLGEWLINVNVGDSRTVLITAPEPSTPLPVTTPYTVGIDKDYNFEVEFASQDHKPYLEHLARHILANGGEFVDSVQNRVIKLEVEKLKEDGNRHAKRSSLKNARIRPKDYQPPNNHDQTAPSSLPKTTGNNAPEEYRDRDRVPSLNVARSCGDLDFKMDPEHKIISCEPDVTFIRIADTRRGDRTTIRNGPNKEKRRHFLFMSTDGTFDYMYEEIADRQNKAIAKVLGPMIEDGEKIGPYLLDEEDKVREEALTRERQAMRLKKAQTAAPAIPPKHEHQENVAMKEKQDDDEDQIDIMDSNTPTATTEIRSTEALIVNGNQEAGQAGSPMSIDPSSPMSVEQTDAPQTDETTEEDPALVKPKPLLHKEIDDEDLRARRSKERTLVHSARQFANREGAHGVFASKLQDYDDCTIILVEI
ncbi:hypothetical protein MAM1_0389d10257 [Mucor ambiguus]|uniref:PPM-type phosphatase domain-containing protein n=1 Tax=Mucor ambiguus TaxID=91626 RepID=A0A0C9N3S2_9FUNG|nr:hypothetical protein MAM1_0389d10257 [Mucor ambiguus]